MILTFSKLVITLFLTITSLVAMDKKEDLTGMHDPEKKLTTIFWIGVVVPKEDQHLGPMHSEVSIKKGQENRVTNAILSDFVDEYADQIDVISSMYLTDCEHVTSLTPLLRLKIEKLFINGSTGIYKEALDFSKQKHCSVILDKMTVYFNGGMGCL